MMKIKVILIVMCGALFVGGKALAQDFAVKTNLLYGATATPNLQFEFGLGKRTTLEIGGNYNPFTFKDDKKWKHWLVQPELRLWNCEKFNRGFWGFHLVGGEFNAAKVKMPFDLWPRLEKSRFEGWMIGGGISYGYQWYLGPHWNLEATVGVGYMYLDMSRYECGDCGRKIGDETMNYVGPTKLGLTLVYLF